MKRTARLALRAISFVIMLYAAASIPATAQGVSSKTGIEEKPAFGQNEALLKITIRLPDGYTSPEEELVFYIQTEVTNPGSSTVNSNRMIMMPKGARTYTAFNKISASGGRADCVVSYIPGWTLGLLGAYASETGTSLTRGDHPITVKPGEIREITLEAIPGVPVSGVIQLPASAKPGKSITLITKGQNGRYPGYAEYTQVNLSGNTLLVPYKALLPKGEVFNVAITDIFAPRSYTIQSETISIPDAGDEKQVKNFTVADPVKITFADPEMEKLVRATVAQPTGDLYDYMVNRVVVLEIDGTKVKSLEDLPKMKSVSTLKIKKFSNIAPYLPAIGGMSSLTTLEILLTEVPNLSYLKNLKNLERLCLNNTKTTDISDVGELSRLVYLDTSNTHLWVNERIPYSWMGNAAPGVPAMQIRDHSPIAKLKKLQTLNINCTTNENLDFLAQCDSLTSLTVDCGWKVSDISFVTRIKKLNYVVIKRITAYVDVSPLLSLKNDVVIVTDVGAPSEVAQRHALVQKKAQVLLAAIIKPGMSDLEKEIAINDWIVANVKYGRTNGWACGSAYGGLIDNLTVCQGYSNTFALLMNSVGVECLIIVGTVKDPDGILQKMTDQSLNHGWNAVKLDNEYYLVDTTWNAGGGSFFNETSYIFSIDHEWDEEAYPAFTGKKYLYNNLPRKTEAAKTPAAVKPVPAPAVKKADMARVKGGAFKNRKSNYYGNKVTLPDFSIGVCEITQKEWSMYMNTNPSTNKGSTLPVENVSWNDCIEYCNKCSKAEGLTPCYIVDSKKKTVTRNPKANGYRLPTDMEWEYAASGGSMSESYLYSGDNSPERAVVYGCTSSVPVGNTSANELGLYDMSGNVSEWCWDAASDVKGIVSTSKDRYSAVNHIARGGSYIRSADYCTIAFRDNAATAKKKDAKGLRIARNN